MTLHKQWLHVFWSRIEFPLRKMKVIFFGVSFIPFPEWYYIALIFECHVGFEYREGIKIDVVRNILFCDTIVTVTWSRFSLVIKLIYTTNGFWNISSLLSYSYLLIIRRDVSMYVHISRVLIYTYIPTSVFPQGVGRAGYFTFRRHF